MRRIALVVGLMLLTFAFGYRVGFYRAAMAYNKSLTDALAQVAKDYHLERNSR